MYTMYIQSYPGCMSTIADYDSVSDARIHFKHLLDAAAAGVPSHLRRDDERFAVVDARLLTRYLSAVVPRAEVVAEDGAWSVFIPGVPVAADSDSFDGAVEEMVVALREYAEDWAERLRHAPNHRDNWGLVQLVALSDDEQLAAWVAGSVK
jgi:hypothetical protein